MLRIMDSLIEMHIFINVHTINCCYIFNFNLFLLMSSKVVFRLSL